MSMLQVIDELIRPKGGQLVLLAGRPGVGKTSLLKQWVTEEHGRGKEVVYFSYDNTKDELALPPQIQVIDECRWTIDNIEAHCRTHKQKGLNLVLIDYLQLIPPSRPASNRKEEFNNLIWGLKSLALTLELPVVVSCQLMRTLREDQRPQLQDLYESRQCLLYADVVALLNRDELLEIELIKNDNGPLSRIKLKWEQGRYCVL